MELQPSEGRLHLSTPGRLVFRSDPPNSGTHAPSWAAPGVYNAPLPPQFVVRALEHGDVVLYHDIVAERDWVLIKAGIGRFSDSRGDLLAVRRPGLGQKVILTGWTSTLRLKEFDPESAAAFIDQYRGRGPESLGR